MVGARMQLWLAQHPLVLASRSESRRAVLDYLDRRNQNPRPFVWTADADLILGKIQRLCKRTYRSGH